MVVFLVLGRVVLPVLEKEAGELFSDGSSESRDKRGMAAESTTENCTLSSNWSFSRDTIFEYLSTVLPRTERKKKLVG